MPRPAAPKPFVWTPGHGRDLETSARMQRHFLRPHAPMEGAWVMSGKRESFDHLMGPLDSVSTLDLRSALDEIIMATNGFGLQKEWHDWGCYLIGNLIDRCHDEPGDALLADLICAFMSQFPTGNETMPYREFLDDLLDTLGRAIMDPECWSGNQIVLGSMLHRVEEPWALGGIGGWSEPSGDFSASMFFCLKYLPASAIPAWFASVLAIESPHWRAQVMVWLVGASPMLRGAIKMPSELAQCTKASVTWGLSAGLSGCLGDHSRKAIVPDFIAKPNRDAVLEVVHQTMSEGRYLEWLLSISPFDYLEVGLGLLPEEFAKLYVPGYVGSPVKKF